MNYAIEHEGKSIGPAGLVTRPDGMTTDEYNKSLEAREIEWLKTGPDKVMLYVKDLSGLNHPNCGMRAAIQTWLGTSVGEYVYVGRRVNGGFGYNTYKRHVECRIFGVKYHGWYMESSGDYCRLKRSKA